MVSEKCPPSCDISSQRASIILNERQQPKEHRTLHSHPHYEILYIIKGSRHIEIADKSFYANPGDLVIFRPGEVHIEYAGSNLISFFVLRFMESAIASTKGHFPSFSATGSKLAITHRKEFFELLSEMVREGSSTDVISDRIFNLYLSVFVLKLERNLMRTADGRNYGAGMRVKRALGMMKDHYELKTSLGDVAQDAFMSKSYFSHSFKKQVGESPKRFIIRHRIQAAQRLLLETKLSAAEVAAQLGYENCYYFYRQFKAETGMTAKAFRSSLKS